MNGLFIDQQRKIQNGRPGFETSERMAFSIRESAGALAPQCQPDVRLRGRTFYFTPTIALCRKKQTNGASMSFTGVSITAGYVGAAQPHRAHSSSIMSRLSWQESPEQGVPTGKGAPPETTYDGQGAFNVRASMDIWFAYGADPDPVNGPRVLVAANTDRFFYAKNGDKAAWASA